MFVEYYCREKNPRTASCLACDIDGTFLVGATVPGALLNVYVDLGLAHNTFHVPMTASLVSALGSDPPSLEDPAESVQSKCRHL